MTDQTVDEVLAKKRKALEKARAVAAKNREQNREREQLQQIEKEKGELLALDAQINSHADAWVKEFKRSDELWDLIIKLEKKIGSVQKAKAWDELRLVNQRMDVEQARVVSLAIRQRALKTKYGQD